MAKEVDEYGACHIVIDDWNLEDHNLDHCLNETNIPITKEEESFLNKMKTLTIGERYTVMAIHNKFI